MAETIIDFHTHAFAEEIVQRAMAHLTSHSQGVKPCHDGRVSSLVDSMDQAGISKSVVCPIATKVKQFDTILQWCKDIRSSRLEPFPSVHPDDDRAVERLEIIKSSGFKGIKLHPYYQDFVLDEDKAMAVYEKADQLDLIVVSHTGCDIAFCRDDRAMPERIINVVKSLPNLKFIATHFGAWQQWQQVREKMIGREIYIEISFSMTYLEPEVARQMLLAHPGDYLLFGTDSPWQGQKLTVELLKSLNLPDDLLAKIFADNAKRLLNG